MAAASLAFSFVFIHSFEDGNGRLNRCVVHHVPALTGFNQQGPVFPVSAVIFEKM
ncbi:MAG: Fic family protein [Albidovulum sp.]|nr:Fic family protein [Albidovulum sp.]